MSIPVKCIKHENVYTLFIKDIEEFLKYFDNLLPNLSVLEEYSECLGKVVLRQKDLDEIT
ncbi:13272_t:CDS:2, partial [Funneliformis geosporum]